MTRPIKFRAWDNQLSEMVYSVNHISRFWELVAYNEYSDPMQFTGLTDKNGKEIFESDLLEVSEDGEPISGVVVWSDDFCGWALQTEDWHMRLSNFAPATFEVKGNKYETR